MGEGLIMELEEKITAIERMLDQLSKPPEDIPNCEVVIERVCCEKHGEYEQRKRILTSSIINLPSPPTRCPGCLEDELNFLRMKRFAGISEFASKLQKGCFASWTYQSASPRALWTATSLLGRILSEHYGSARPTHRNGLIASSRAVGWLCVASLVPVKTTLRWPLPAM
jgi:hypothetical protein